MDARERRYIGGSDAGTILGVNPWSSQWQLWMRIAAPHLLRDRPAPGQCDDVDPLERGSAFEAGVASLYAARTGAALVEAAEVAHPDHPFLRAHFDRIDTRDGSIVEIKTADSRAADQWGGSGSGPQSEARYPAAYHAQVLHYLALAPSAPYATLVVMLGTRELRWYRVERDEEAIRSLIAAEVEWWRVHVEVGHEPDILDGPAPLENVRVRWPTSRQPLLPGDERHLDAARAYVEARAAVKAAEEWRDAVQARLCALLGDAEGVSLEGMTVTWRNNKPSEKTDWRAVALALNAPADLVAKHTTIAAGARPLRVVVKEPK